MVIRRVRLVRSGMLVEFAVVLAQRDHRGKSHEVMSIDTRNHGTVHRHGPGHGPPETIEEISSPNILERALSEAIDETYAAYNRIVEGNIE